MDMITATNDIVPNYNPEAMASMVQSYVKLFAPTGVLPENSFLITMGLLLVLTVLTIIMGNLAHIMLDKIDERSMEKESGTEEEESDYK